MAFGLDNQLQDNKEWTPGGQRNGLIPKGLVRQLRGDLPQLGWLLAGSATGHPCGHPHLGALLTVDRPGRPAEVLLLFALAAP
jgi:hypothetical protein